MQPNCYYCRNLDNLRYIQCSTFLTIHYHKINVFPKKWQPAYCRWHLPHTGLVTQAEMSHKGLVFSSSYMKATSSSHYQYIGNNCSHYIPIHFHRPVKLANAQQSLFAHLLFYNFVKAAKLWATSFYFFLFLLKPNVRIIYHDNCLD